MDKVLFIKEKDLDELIKRLIKVVIDKIPKEEPKDLLSYDEGAKLLDIKKETLTRHVNDGLYKKHYSKSGKPYVSRKEILAGFN
ncbi:MAG: hypothetical protein AB8G11_06275 [Saprospiraceae bacterium]